MKTLDLPYGAEIIYQGQPGYFVVQYEDGICLIMLYREKRSEGKYVQPEEIEVINDTD